MPDKQMKKIVPVTKFDEIQKLGEKTYNENKVMALVADIMSDSKFRTLFDEYFNDWNDIKTILMIMKVYQTIETNNQDKKLDKKEIIGAVQSVILNSDMRLNMVNAMDNFMSADIKKKSIKKKKTKSVITNETE